MSDIDRSRREFLRDATTVGLGTFFGSLLGMGASSIAGCQIAGPGRFGAVDPESAGLSREAKALIDACWRGLDPAQCWDTHVHLVGLGAGGTGCRVKEEMRSGDDLVSFAKFLVYRRAAGIEDENIADEQYVARLLGLKRDWNPQGRLVLLAFDEAYDEKGEALPEATDFYTPNEWARDVAARHPDDFAWTASIHPYRPDAIDLLERCAEEGAQAVKWLPNAQLMDAASPKCDRFYAKLAELGIPLLTHVGEEQAVEAEEAQRLGNPLRFRRALDAGVKVVMAHVASLGSDHDLEASPPPAPEAEPTTSSFDLFLRLFLDPQYGKNLLADLSATIQFNRCEGALREVIATPSLHDRLLYASDYPLPAINVIVHLDKLVNLGYLTPEQSELAGEIYTHNPLTFNFVLLRQMAVRGQRLENATFQTRRHLPAGGVGDGTARGK